MVGCGDFAERGRTLTIGAKKAEMTLCEGEIFHGTLYGDEPYYGTDRTTVI
jgi:hypothetical protein